MRSFNLISDYFFISFQFPQQKSRDNQSNKAIKYTHQRPTINQRSSVPTSSSVSDQNSNLTTIPKTFASQKKLLNDYYNWNVDFPSTTIHQNSILYRDSALNESFRRKLQIMSDRMMTLGAKREFGGSNMELSPRKFGCMTLSDLKTAKSEISLNQMRDESAAKLSSSLFNLLTAPFSWTTRQFANKNRSSDDKENPKPNILMNLFRKKRIMCNSR